MARTGLILVLLVGRVENLTGQAHSLILAGSSCIRPLHHMWLVAVVGELVVVNGSVGLSLGLTLVVAALRLSY